MPGQKYKKKLSPMQTANMIRTAAQKPDERKYHIERVLEQRARFNEDPTVRAFGMRVRNKMQEVCYSQLTEFLSANR